MEVWREARPSIGGTLTILDLEVQVEGTLYIILSRARDREMDKLEHLKYTNPVHIQTSHALMLGEDTADILCTDIRVGCPNIR